MFLRKYWLPISVFIVAIVGIGLYLLATQPPPEPVKIYKAVEPEKPTEQPKAEVVEDDTSQGGHLHADGTWHAEPHAERTVRTTTTPQNRQADFAQENEQETQVDFVTIPVPADPMRALLEQTERRGHWSAGRLPPFPPEDTEAAELAACVYLITEYRMRKDYDNPNLYNAWERFNELIRPISALTEQRHISPRTHDLLRFRWPLISEAPPEPGKNWRSNFDIR
ncbi:MAG: hypothetical protein OXU51_10585 [Candidatus Poribacteria bacterium]|nr:hypothetical protein [Candidatus Poribacteria bacterium]